MNRAHFLTVPPRRILVPLDLSPASTLAWRQAERLALRFDAELEGLFIEPWIHEAFGWDPSEPYRRAHSAELSLDALKARLGAKAKVRLATGSFEETVLAWGAELEFDLIVLAVQGRPGPERALKESVAESIIRHCDVPVLAAREPVARVRTVLAPVNFEPYSYDGLLYAARMAAALRARLEVLHVVTGPMYADRDAMKGPKLLLASAVAGLPPRVRDLCRPKTQLAFGDPSERISLAAEDADMVALVAHRKGFLNEVVFGTTAERVLRHCGKAVLAVPAGAAARQRGRPEAAARVAAHA